MYYIDDITTLDAQLLTGTTLAEDPTTAWAGYTAAVGDYRHVVATHRVYKCAVAGVSSISPELAPTVWVDTRPTNKWAPFDVYTNTAATDTTDITYVLGTRFANVILLRGLAGKASTISIKDAPGGATIYPAKTFSIQQSASGYYDYAFGTRKTKPTLVITGLPIRSNAEITITVSAISTNTRAIGMIVRGKLRALYGTGIGGAQWDADAAPKTFTYRKTNDDGTVTTLPRGSSKDISFVVMMEIAQADQAVQELERLMARPVAVFATTKAGFAGLSAFGYVTKSPVTYKSGFALCSINVEGNI